MATNESTGTKKKEPNPGFVKPLVPDEILAAIIGPDAIPRTEIVKKLWAYIKSHKLQEKKIIKADAKLKALFDGAEEMDMFTMNRFLSKHVKAAAVPEEKPAKKAAKKKE